MVIESIYFHLNCIMQEAARLVLKVTKWLVCKKDVLWGFGIDKKTPDLYDWIGAGICLIGVSVMLFAPRQ